MDMPNIQYKGDFSKFIEASDDEEAILYFKDQEYFFDDSAYTKFIKEVERTVRTSKDYSTFVGYIKNTLGLNFAKYLLISLRVKMYRLKCIMVHCLLSMMYVKLF